MKALIYTENTYLFEGVRHKIENIILNIKVTQCKNIDELHDISDYYFIFFDISSGKVRLCYEFFLSRKKGSLLFLITNKQIVKNYMLTACMYGAVIIERKSSLTEYHDSIFNVISSAIATCGRELELRTIHCATCCYESLSNMQLVIAFGLKKGYSVKELAYMLNISPKTISSQINRIKNKFLITSNIDWSYFIHGCVLTCATPIKPIPNDLNKKLIN